VVNVPENAQFDREKFKDVVHYVCARVPSARLGKTKFHKCLYYFDMWSHATTGSPATGATYVKAPFGPLAAQLDKALKWLGDDNRVAISKSNFHGLEKWEFASLAEPNLSRMNGEEVGLLDMLCDWVCNGHTAKDISEVSHQLPWHSVGMGEPIPYRTAILMFGQDTSEEALDWAEEMAGEVEAGTGRYLDSSRLGAFRARVFAEHRA